MSNARAGRSPARFLPLILGLLLVAALGAGAITVRAGAQHGTPPPQLSEEDLLSRITAAPKEAPDFRATVSVEQTLVPEQLLGASRGDGGSNSGPRTARVWYGGPDKLRAELQGQNGDQVFVRNGSEVRTYDGATNTLKTGEKPQETSDTTPQDAASPDKINQFLADISPTSDLKTGPPVQVAGRWAYPLTLAPKDKSSTLVDRAEAYVDAEAFVPLSFELYAKDTPDPVVRYQASSFELGPVPDNQFDLQTPPGATVAPVDPQNGSDHKNSGESQKPSKVASVAEAQKLVNFPVKQLADTLGGRELTQVRVTGSGGVVLNYGSDWGTVVLTQKPEGAGESSKGETQNQTDNGRKGPRVPTVDLGGGVEAKEISTPIGSWLSWSADGVSYSLTGSVPAADLEGAARGLLSG